MCSCMKNINPVLHASLFAALLFNALSRYIAEPVIEFKVNMHIFRRETLPFNLALLLNGRKVLGPRL